LLGAGPLQGLWLCTGHHRNGVLLAAISAELVAKDLGGEPLDPAPTELDSQGLLAAFAWSRFRDDA
jgi:glycine oxidase